MRANRNVGPVDAAVRALLGIVLLAAAAIFNQRPFLALGAAFLALIFLGTAVTRVCPLYVLVGMTTRDREAPQG
ncbi:MAG TPA: DUF2892 domain-containing protein [Gemmatimonadales bacterium]